MNKFFCDVLKKLISTVLFTLLMFVASYCLITGEFPPKIANMKMGLQNMQAQIKQLKKIQENQLAKLSQGPDQEAEMKYQQALVDKIKELEARITRLESKNSN